METKITKGDWIANKRNAIGDIIIWANGTPRIAVLPLRDVSYNEQEANAKLIEDAGTTANKCGLLPSEILKQRDELLEVLETMMIGLMDCDGVPDDGHSTIRMGHTVSLLNKAKQAIKNATK